MRVSENLIQPTQQFRKLKSREYSMKKNQSTNQTSEKPIYSPYQSAKKETSRAQVSEFKLGNTPFPKQLTNLEPIANFIQIENQIQMTPFQINIHSSIMNAFKQEFLSFKQSLTLSSKSQKACGLVQNSKKQPNCFRQNVQKPQSSASIKSNNQKRSTNSFAENQPINIKINQNTNANDQVSCISFRKNEKNLQTIGDIPSNHQKTSSLQIDTQNQVSRQGIGIVHSPSLELSPQQKEFKRSFQFSHHNPSQVKSDENELSLFSTLKSDLNKKKSALDNLYKKLSNDQKVFVTNKLLFLRDHA